MRQGDPENNMHVEFSQCGRKCVVLNFRGSHDRVRVPCPSVLLNNIEN